MRFWGLEPSFSGISSTKSGFLCAFALWNPCFRAFRAQNRHFCAFLAFGTPIFGHFEHKIEVFVLFCPSEPPFSGFSSTKSAFLCALVGPRLGRRPGVTGATRATGATGATGTTRATATTGATGTTAGIVWVADILSQGGVV